MKDTQQLITIGCLALLVQCSSFFFAGRDSSLHRVVSIPTDIPHGFSSIQTTNIAHSKVVNEKSKYSVKYFATSLRTVSLLSYGV